MEENENRPTAAEASAESAAEQGASEAQTYESLAKLLEAHFVNLRNLLHYTKEKDANVMALSRQLQQYRDGFESVLFKRIALDIIGYREDCRKSLREAGDISSADAKKYLAYLVQDYEDLLQNAGIEGTSEDFTYFGKKPVSEEKISYREIPAEEEAEVPMPEIGGKEDFAAYLKACEDALRATLARNTALDCVLSDYIAASSLYEHGVWQIVLVPVLRKMLSDGEALRQFVCEETERLNEENAAEIYKAALTRAVGICDGILERCNVFIDGSAADVYDPKHQRILKMVPTEDETLNGTVVNRYTDCYLMDEKVIYPSKVDVYKKK